MAYPNYSAIITALEKALESGDDRKAKVINEYLMKIKENELKAQMQMKIPLWATNPLLAPLSDEQRAVAALRVQEAELASAMQAKDSAAARVAQAEADHAFILGHKNITDPTFDFGFKENRTKNLKALLGYVSGPLTEEQRRILNLLISTNGNTVYQMIVAQYKEAKANG